MSNLSATSQFSRRTVCGVMLGLAVSPFSLRAAPAPAAVLVYKDPSCGCCGGWAKLLEAAGLSVKIEETSNLAAIRSRLGVPSDLAACHTAEVGGYLVEGHVPAVAIKRLLEERPEAAGIAVPGMPPGSPGMGGKPQHYAAILFGPSGRREYKQFVGSETAG